MEDRLLEYYNLKYAHEASETTVTPVPLHQPHPADRFAAAVAFLPPRLPTGADILELGAGNGCVAESLRVGGVPFGTYTIGDISDVRLTGLKNNLTDERYRFVRADAERASDAVEGHFDAVVMMALIEHLIDPIRAMRDIHGLLKPNGFVYIGTPNIAKWTRRIKLAFGRFPSTASKNEGLTTFEGRPADLYDEGHLHYFTFRSLSMMLIDHCGFQRVERLGTFVGPRQLGPRLGYALARRWPTMFSDITCIAYA